MIKWFAIVVGCVDDMVVRVCYKFTNERAVTANKPCLFYLDPHLFTIRRESISLDKTRWKISNQMDGQERWKIFGEKRGEGIICLARSQRDGFRSATGITSSSFEKLSSYITDPLYYLCVVWSVVYVWNGAQARPLILRWVNNYVLWGVRECFYSYNLLFDLKRVQANRHRKSYG